MARPKLLLADDSVTIRKVVELTFADEGIDVTTAADAESAMQKFNEVQPDIVLVDISLPGTSGYHICEMIKQDDATSHIPVLLLVGSFEPFDQDEAERVCSDGFLTKPFHSIRDLVGRVWDLLGRDASVEEISVEEPQMEPDVDGDVVPVGQEETAPEISHAGSEVSDIEHLYDSSFANTAEIEEFDTLDDLLGDPGMDDELIEAHSAANTGVETPVQNIDIHDEPAATKEFDWSPEALIENEPPSDYQPVSDELDDISLHDTVADDPTGGEWRSNETSMIVEPAAEADNDDFSLHETDGDVATNGQWRSDEAPLTTKEPAEDVYPAEEPVPAVQDDITAEGEHVDQRADEVNYDEGRSLEEPPTVDESYIESTDKNLDVPPYDANSPFAETVETNVAEIMAPVPGNSDEQPPAVTQSDEPSPEMIALIAQRVIDHLSDSVVRDIAMEAVPRIAEKLMREALDKESKS